MRTEPAALLLLCLAAPPTGAAGQADFPVIPPHDTLRARVADEVRAPAGLSLTLFAAPPAVNYPVSLAAGGPGEIFVAVDPNLNFDLARGRGSLVRLLDADGDGVAERRSTFASGLDSPRGMVFDGGTLYLAHAPHLSALRDTDGDGVADRREVLVTGLGFQVDPLGGDHTVNGMVMGIDGWLYLAVGDYGFREAVGRDGSRLRLRGGGVVRVRPDGSGLELYATGTRNIYDLAVDPLLDVFARDNNNNGQGWGVRLHHLPQGAELGYPSLFRNFPEEVLPSLADYGAGAGSAALWVEEPGLPARGLVTADWGLNQLFVHPLDPRGGSFQVAQEPLLSVPRPSDMVVDGRGDLFVASLSGGSYFYAGEGVGYLVRLRGEAPAPLPADPLERLRSRSAVTRLAAQRELIRRGENAATVAALEALVLAAGPLEPRAAALFALKQIRGAGAHPFLLRAARDPALRALALRALVDRREQLRAVPARPFLDALSDPDPRVRGEGVNGLLRLGARVHADRVLGLANDPDRTVAHLAGQAVIGLGATDAAFRALDREPGLRSAALRVLARFHEPEVVDGLVRRARAERRPAERAELLFTLARLHHREGEWGGEWWDNVPGTDGPYYDPRPWSESPRILAVLRSAMAGASGAETDGLIRGYTRNGVLPPGSDSLLLSPAVPAPRRPALAAAMVGEAAPGARTAEVLRGLMAGDPAAGAAVATLLATQTRVPDEAVPLLVAVATDRSLPVALRLRAIAPLTRQSGSVPIATAARAFAALAPTPGGEPEMEAAWRRFTGNRRHAAALEHFTHLAHSSDSGERLLGLATLVQIARTAQHPAPVRRAAQGAIDGAWTDPLRARALVQAIDLVGARDLYRDLPTYQRAATLP